jgi:pimeloyl-ACP methyl ester carboxylesterase
VKVISSRTITGAQMNQTTSRTRQLALVVVTALASLSVACSATPAERAGPSTTALAWSDCPDDVVDPLSQLQCAPIPVPLDYQDPAGVTIDIMVSRLASADPSTRRGVLLLNPGGPGESGLSQSLDLVDKGLPVSVTNGYDVIGMDTRGIGYSAPISCGFGAAQAYTGPVPTYASDRTAVAAEAEVVKGIAAQCAAHDVDGRLRHISTANTARDLDRIRVALGEDKISYFGVSYGTALGAAYASMFPDHSDRIVLDSAIGDTYLDRDGMRRYGLGAEQTFPDFARWAAARDGTYGLGRTPSEVRGTYFALAARLDQNPVAGMDGHTFRLVTFVSLYNEVLYTKAAQLWQSMLLSDEPTAQPDPDPDAPPAAPPVPDGQLSPSDNSWSVFLASTCNDSAFTDDVATYQRAVAEDRKTFPVFGAATADIMPCAFWAYPPSEPPVPIVDEGPQNVLVLQNRRDPVTPYAGGVLLREKFEKRSRLVSVDGSGHGAYVYGDSPCTDNLTTTYLVGGAMPAKDLSC